MSGSYPDKPPAASDGKSFEQLGVRLFKEFLGEEVHIYGDKWSQYNVGESKEKVEFKELKNSPHQLFIETHEKTRIDNPWIPSGILRQDNTERYVCGSHADIFVFRKDVLVDYYRKIKPEEQEYGWDPIKRHGRIATVGVLPYATIRTFPLSKDHAVSLCEHRFILESGRWSHVIKRAPGGERNISGRELAKIAIRRKIQFEFISGQWP